MNSSEEEVDDWYYWFCAGRVVRSPRVEFDDQIRGECSGLPQCCITFFISENWMDSETTTQHEERMAEVRREGFNFLYVPCPECLTARRFVQIKSCDESNCFCDQWKYKELVKYELEERKQRRRSRMSRKKRRGYI